MKIIVCAKQVPDTNEVKIDPVKGTLIRDGVPSILNPDDANALEAALEIKDKYPDTTVTIVSMGPPQANYMLRECLAMGADDAYLLSSRAFGGADTCATSTTIAAGIRKIGKYDIIFAGRQAIDGDTAQVGPQTAQRLGIPSVTYVQKIREIKKGSVVVERALEDGYEVIEVKTPCLLTAIKELNEPRYMTVGQIEEAYKKPIATWSEVDVNLAPEDCGLKASPTQVFKSFTPPPKGKGEMLQGTVPEMAAALIAKLTEKHVIK
ncbi:electron transfer flavoprotein beta subunit [Sporobacter termitidis DSM 10068]|uniref:Electron transfer flavoprotein small subunit n=1 Tax=Sporobacter termitidis DSM 10068 TaxID=1123282 RepID=A0A1M5YX37_9FIRM|nr:electron transfer flavoprotein subunit beta [Sporobacter termitidis]SHI16587.1 electron transfer flavoprotein beta subunit [Sporobacter termitidis DSM 10068]